MEDDPRDYTYVADLLMAKSARQNVALIRDDVGRRLILNGVVVFSEHAKSDLSSAVEAILAIVDPNPVIKITYPTWGVPNVGTA